MKPFITLFAVLLVLMQGCSPFNVADYSDFTPIGPDGIPTDWEYEFSPSQTDSLLDLSGKYDVIIALRYTNLCPSKSVVLNIEEFSLMHEHPDTLKTEITLFDELGNPLGQVHYGIFEITDTLKRDYRLPDGYTLSVSSPLPASATAGVRAIGLILNDRERQQILFR